MANDFSDPFRYGLNNLPAEPPDRFNALYSPGQDPSMGFPPLGAPQVVQAGVRFPRLRSAPQPGLMAPEGVPPAAGPFPTPQLPDWWKVLWPAIQIYHKTLRDFVGGGGRSGRGDEEEDGDECYKRYQAEDTECNWRAPQFVRGCKDRATERWIKCNKNGGEPDPDEPPKWGWADEEGPRGPRKFRK